MRLENNVISKSEQISSYFANYGVLLGGRKAFSPPPAGVAGAGRPASIGFNSGANHGFGAGENDWLGAEAYIAPLR